MTTASIQATSIYQTDKSHPKIPVISTAIDPKVDIYDIPTDTRTLNPDNCAAVADNTDPQTDVEVFNQRDVNIHSPHTDINRSFSSTIEPNTPPPKITMQPTPPSRHPTPMESDSDSLNDDVPTTLTYSHSPQSEHRTNLMSTGLIEQTVGTSGSNPTASYSAMLHMDTTSSSDPPNPTKDTFVTSSLTRDMTAGYCGYPQSQPYGGGERSNTVALSNRAIFEDGEVPQGDIMAIQPLSSDGMRLTRQLRHMCRGCDDKTWHITKLEATIHTLEQKITDHERRWAGSGQFEVHNYQYNQVRTPQAATQIALPLPQATKEDNDSASLDSGLAPSRKTFLPAINYVCISTLSCMFPTNNANMN